MMTIEYFMLSSFRSAILASRMDGVVLYINPIGNKILDGFTIRDVGTGAGSRCILRIQNR